MTKKIVWGVVLFGLIGLLVAGAVVRSVAKTGDGTETRGGYGRNQGLVDSSANAGLAERPGQQGTGGSGDGRGPAGNATDLNITADGTGAGYRGGYGRAGRGVTGVQNAGLAVGGAIIDAPVGSLSEAEANALRAALADECAAKALYEQAMADLGQVQPLTNIERAEEQHTAALERLFNSYGLEIPADPGDGQDLTFATLADACAAGVSAETANVALYDQLLAQVDNPDLVRVFTALQSASQTRHLPALEACAP